MTVQEKRDFIDKNLRELISESDGATETSLRKELDDWVVAFRTSEFHKTTVTGLMDMAEDAIKARVPAEIRGRIPTTVALVYFLLGRRAARRE